MATFTTKNHNFTVEAPYEQPKALPGYEHINRYWDRTNDTYAAKILPGEYYVTMHGEIVTTVLGSCISACIRDRKLGIGGMNHFMLPHKSQQDSWGDSTSAARYGHYAMEIVINDILKNGGRRANLEVKLFGGGQVLAQKTSVGDNNISFVRDYLHSEGLELISEDLGGKYPRKVIYYPNSGRVRIKKLKTLSNQTIAKREHNYQETLDHQPVGQSVELF